MKESKLVAACQDITKLLKLKPEIMTEDKEQMKKDLKQAAKLLNSADMGKLANGTISILRTLNIILPKMPKGHEEKNPPVEVKPKKGKGEKKVGVIASIVEIVEEKGPISVDRIVAALKKRFPERDEKGMKSTTKIQLSFGLAKKGVILKKDSEGNYSIGKGKK